MRGRRPKPTALKRVTGNPGGRRLPDHELQPEGKAVMPKYLRGIAARLWKEYAPQLDALGTLTAVDSAQFAVWCSLAADFERRPSEMCASKIAKMIDLAGRFGMDASSRARLGTGDGKHKDKDPAEEFFTGPRLATG